MKRLFPICILLIAMLFGCTVPANVPEPTPDVQSPVTEQIVFVPSEAPTEAPTSVPTETPAPTPTETPTQEPTDTPAPFDALALPETLRPKNGYTASSLPGVVRRNADGAFFAYGSVGGTEPCFYPCDENGTVAPGETPVEWLAVPVYTPSEAPKKGIEWLLVVYLPTQSVVAFHYEDGDWIEQRIMICSTGRSKHDTPVGSYKIYQRYTYKSLGTGDTSCYGLWACRFKNHYLFHSVPISLDAGRSAEKGHRMCDMHKFEKLGTVASDGCVRLCVADAKWIYDLSEDKTVSVRVTKDGGPTPTKPPAVIWEEPYTDKNGYGWDPTDPDPDNPYLGAETP